MNDIWSACAERWITEKCWTSNNMQMRSLTFPLGDMEAYEKFFLPIFITRTHTHIDRMSERASDRRAVRVRARAKKENV